MPDLVNSTVVKNDLIEIQIAKTANTTTNTEKPKSTLSSQFKWAHSKPPPTPAIESVVVKTKAKRTMGGVRIDLGNVGH